MDAAWRSRARSIGQKHFLHFSKNTIKELSWYHHHHHHQQKMYDVVFFFFVYIRINAMHMMWWTLQWWTYYAGGPMPQQPQSLTASIRRIDAGDLFYRLFLVVIVRVRDAATTTTAKEKRKNYSSRIMISYRKERPPHIQTKIDLPTTCKRTGCPMGGVVDIWHS